MQSFVTQEGSKKRIKEVTVSPSSSPTIPEEAIKNNQCSNKRQSEAEKLAHSVLEHFAIERSEQAAQAALERQTAADIAQNK